MTDPIPNTGPGKFVAMGIGVAGGLAATAALRAALAEPETGAELEAKGIEVLDSSEAGIYAMAMPFAVAAGIGLGLQKRSPTAGFTTTSQVATAALLSTVAGAVINADSDKTADYAIGIGAMAAATGAGVMMGVRDEVHAGRTRMGGLLLFGMAVGAGAPIAWTAIKDIPNRLGASFEHRER